MMTMATMSRMTAPNKSGDNLNHDDISESPFWAFSSSNSSNSNFLERGW